MNRDTQPNRLLPVILAFAALAVLSATAQASSGDPQIDQYTESIPNAGGSDETGGGGGGNGGSGGDGEGAVLTPEQSENLQAQGADGAGVADLAEETAPGSNNGANANNGNGNASSGQGNDENISSTPASASANPASGGAESSSDSGDGMGVILPLLLLAAVAAAGIVFFIRRRGGSTQSA